jgi:Bacteriophage Sf6, terminase small subunit-like
MTQDQPNNLPVEQKSARVVTQYSDEQRQEIVASVFEGIIGGNSAEQACNILQVPLATVLGWIGNNPAWEVEYERLKITRARAYVERSLYEIETANEVNDAKIAETKARIWLKVAALLNPKEFSDKMHSNAYKQPSRQAVSFVLNMGGTTAQQGSSITITAQPEDGD